MFSIKHLGFPFFGLCTVAMFKISSFIPNVPDGVCRMKFVWVFIKA